MADMTTGLSTPAIQCEARSSASGAAAISSERMMIRIRSPGLA